MGKFLVRITVIIVSIYFVLAYLIAQFLGIDILREWYIIPFELIVVVYSFSEGKYHCKFLKSTMLSIFLCDLLTRLDNTFDILSVTSHNLIPVFLLTLGIGTSVTLAIRHFYKVIKLKRLLNERTLTQRSR